MSKREKAEHRASKVQRNQLSTTKSVHTKRKQPKTKHQQASAAPSLKLKQELAPVFDDSQQILCVGEGNFSFARALVRILQGQGQQVIATAFDTQEVVLAKYEEGPEPVSEIIQELQDCDASVCFAVDATQLAKSLQARRCI